MTEQERAVQQAQEWNQVIGAPERTGWRGVAPEPWSTTLARYEYTLAALEGRTNRALQLLASLLPVASRSAQAFGPGVYGPSQYESISEFLQGG